MFCQIAIEISEMLLTTAGFNCDSSSPGMHILTENGNVPHQERGYVSLGMQILTGNAYPHREWGCALPGMHILTGNAYPYRKWGCALPRMHILTGNAHSLQKVMIHPFSIKCRKPSHGSRTDAMA